MKKSIWGVLVLILLIAVMACTQMSSSKNVAKGSLANPGPTVVISKPVVKLTKDAKLDIKGTGFQPGQEIHLLMKIPGNVTHALIFGLKPKPVPDKTGSWSTTWTGGRFVTKYITEGAYLIRVTDSEYNLLAAAPVAFIK